MTEENEPVDQPEGWNRLEWSKERRKIDGQRVRDNERRYREAHKEKCADQMRKWREENIEHYREYQREYRRKRLAADPEFRERVKQHNDNHVRDKKVNNSPDTTPDSGN